MVQGEDALRIGVIGLGYIGSVTAAVLAAHGNEVIGIDNVPDKVKAFSSGKIPIYEPGLMELLSNNSSNIRFSNSYEDLKDVETAFICVPTPNRDGFIDTSYVMDAARSLSIVNPTCVTIVKSTVVPGTANKIHEQTGMHVVSNPEFTREGTAIHDTESPDRVVIGGKDKKSCDLVNSIWAFTGAPVVMTSNENAELIKYASNSFLATKISFINEFANLCEKIPGADVETVAKGMGLDQRIGEKFLKAGIGYGGSCFPKDTLAIAAFARTMGTELRIVEAASQVNDHRIEHAISLIEKNWIGEMRDASIGILGVAFKDSTDDVRESQSLRLIHALHPLVKKINVFDPVIIKDIEGAKRFEKLEECISSSDIVVVATEWPQFSKLPENAKGKIIVDLRRVINPKEYEKFVAIGYGIR